MFRKIASLLTVPALLVMAVSVNAGTPNPDDDVNGCFADATPVTVNEGVSIPVTISCVGIPTDNNVFGFQFGTSLPSQGSAGGDYAGSAPSGYTAGQFSSTAVGGVLVGENSLALYGVSRKTNEVVGVTDFTLGSYVLTADTDLTTADGSVAVTFVDSTFNLSDNYGSPLTGWLRVINDDSTVINDIDLAWLNGNMTVRSDAAANALTSIENVTLNLGAKQYSDTSETGYQTVLNIDAAYLYVEDASGVVGGSFAVAQDSDDVLNIAINADMWGHLACSTSAVDLNDTGAAQDVDVFVGTSGVVTLKAGDVDDNGDISNTDFAIIGDDFGDTGASINTSYEGDISMDGSVNIFDLVHIGRNFTATTAACS